MTEWIAIITITCLAVISPGPDFAMISRNAITLSKRAGVLTAFGIGVGVLVHVSYALFGLVLIGQYAAWVLAVMKLVGAAYLVWLGITMLQSQPCEANRPEEDEALSERGAFRMGFLTNALNPKTAIFIVSLFTQVVDGQTPMLTRLAYGGFMSLAHIVWFGAVAVFLGSAVFGQRLIRISHWIDRAFGVALICFGAGLLFADLS